jgi:GT2 family glycosyltransferase
VSTFHLIVSTNRPPEYLRRCVDALRREREDVFVTVVEQHATPRCEAVVADLVADGRAEYVHDPTARGLSRGRNRGLRAIRGDFVAFPDDDCVYAEGVLTAVRELLEQDGSRSTALGSAPDGIAIRMTTEDGRDTMLRWSHLHERVTPARVPHTVCSSGLFFRASTVSAVGTFDEALGTGSGTPFGAGEETDFVLRALANGADIRYDPSLTVFHADWRESEDGSAVLAKVLRYNRGFGRVMRKHRQFGAFAHWTARSAVGVLVRAAQRDRDGVRHQWTQLRGRVEGFCWPMDRGA